LFKFHAVIIKEIVHLMKNLHFSSTIVVILVVSVLQYHEKNLAMQKNLVLLWCKSSV